MGKIKDSEKGKYSSPDGSRTWEYISVSFMSIGMFCLGAVMGWNSPSQVELTSENSPIKMTSEEVATLMACLGVGQFLSIFCSASLVDIIGRRKSIILSILPMMLSWLMIIFANDVNVLIAARILAGFSAGFMINVYPIYMTEIISPSIRGSMLSVGPSTFYVGVLFMYAVAPHFEIKTTAMICMGPAILVLICTWFTPESPYFLMMVGRSEEAETALSKIRGKPDVTDEIELIKATLREKGKSLFRDDENEGSRLSGKKDNPFTRIFTIRGNLKAFFIGMISSFILTFCGIPTIMSYCHLILEATGSGFQVYAATIIISGLQVVSAGLTVLIVDRFDRRTLLFTSGGFTAILNLIIAVYFYLKEYTDVDVKNYTLIPLCCILLLVMAVNVGIVPVHAILASEIYATDIKMLANGIVGIIVSGSSIALVKSYFTISVTWGFGHCVPFFGYTACMIIGLSLLAYLLPETKGRTLLEIQQKLNA